jgi:hypothetical protein
VDPDPQHCLKTYFINFILECVPSEPLAAAASHNIVDLEEMLQGHEEGLQPPVVLRAASIGIQAHNLNQCFHNCHNCFAQCCGSMTFWCGSGSG